jgi:hypothetical protein
MSKYISLAPNPLTPVDNISDLYHAVAQLFPDAIVDVDTDSKMIIIHTQLRVQNDGSLTEPERW